MAFFNFFLIKITSSMDVGSKEFIKSLDLPTGATSWKAGAQWYAARRPSNQDLWYVMEAVSMKYQTEVIGVNLQPEKSFELRAYATGKLKRKLIYAPATGGWTSAQGDEQSWEQTLFFSQAKQDKELAQAANDQEREEIKRTFVAKVIKVNNIYPTAIEEPLAQQILDVFGCRWPAAKKEEKKKSWWQKLLGI